MEKEIIIERILREVDAGHFLNALIFLACSFGSAMFIWLSKYFHGKKIDKLYNDRILDKDEEIKRLKDSEKRLRNILLKTQR